MAKRSRRFTVRNSIIRTRLERGHPTSEPSKRSFPYWIKPLKASLKCPESLKSSALLPKRSLIWTLLTSNCKWRARFTSRLKWTSSMAVRRTFWHQRANWLREVVIWLFANRRALRLKDWDNCFPSHSIMTQYRLTRMWQRESRISDQVPYSSLPLNDRLEASRRPMFWSRTTQSSRWSPGKIT